MLKKKEIRDGKGRTIGFETTGLDGAYETLVHDCTGAVIGRTSTRFGTTRDQCGQLLSNDTGRCRLATFRPEGALTLSDLCNLVAHTPES